MILACVFCALTTTLAQPVPSPVPPAPTATPVASATPVAPPAPPSPTPSPSPSPLHTGRLSEVLLQGGYTVGKVYNDYAPGVTGSGDSTVGAAAVRFGDFAAKVDERTDYFPTLPNAKGLVQFNTIDGGAAFVPPFTGKLTNVDFRLEHRILAPNLYAGISEDRETTSYGYPVISGAGIGLEQYPTFKPFDLTGSLYYYPSVSGSYTVNEPASINFGKSYSLHFSALKYDFGTDFALSDTLYAYIGYGGYRFFNGSTHASSQNAEGPYLGFGTRFFRDGSALDEPNKLVIAQQSITNYNGFVEFSAALGAENAVGAVNADGDSGSYSFSGAYRTGRYAVVGDLHEVSFHSQLDPFVPGPAIVQHDTLGELRAEVSVAPHDAYFGIGVMSKGSNNGFTARPGLGIGFEKLPNLFAVASPFASVFYYDVPGQYSALNPADHAFGQSISLERRYLVYEYGVTYKPTPRIYVFAGLWGYHGNSANLPIDETHSAPYIGLGSRI